MAHPYTTRARVQVAAIARELTGLVDRNGDGAEDAGVLSATIERACNYIDKRLGRRFSVPFAATAEVATDGTIADLSDRITIALLLEPIDYPKYEAMIAKADADLARILDGTDWIDATERTVFTRKGGVRVLSGGTQIAGREDGDYTTPGGEKTYGI